MRSIARGERQPALARGNRVPVDIFNLNLDRICRPAGNISGETDESIRAIGGLFEPDVAGIARIERREAGDRESTWVIDARSLAARDGNVFAHGQRAPVADSRSAAPAKYSHCTRIAAQPHRSFVIDRSTISLGRDKRAAADGGSASA